MYKNFQIGKIIYGVKSMKKNKSNREREKNLEFPDFKSFPTDPNGSWTGVPIDKHEKPIQDADDL